MLVLSRKPGEKVVIGGGITVTVVSVSGNKVRIGIDAPGQVRILRAELLGWQDGPVPDPDLGGKPPEWENGTPDLPVPPSQQ
jgi:carbon storage regulator